MLSEHVLEHLSYDEAVETARNIFQFLAPGGHWRIAVPDAKNPDAAYQDMCRPGGVGRQNLDLWNRLFYGADEPGHKVHYSLASLSSLLFFEGFRVQPLEFYDDAGSFWRAPWSQDAGWIKRSSESGYLLLDYLFTNCWNTSLIVDAIKPVSHLEPRQLYRWAPEVSLQ